MESNWECKGNGNSNCFKIKIEHYLRGVKVQKTLAFRAGSAELARGVWLMGSPSDRASIGQ